jgi:NAD+ synthase (glutamine-hydrolysing)
MLVSIAQINLHVGNIEANTRKIIGCIREAREDLHAELVIFPEMAITGYPPEDLLLRPVFLEQAAQALIKIASCSAGIGVLIGHPTLKDGRLFNSVSYIKNREIQATYHKKQLPNYGVFDEKRYFAAGSETSTIMLGSMPAALCICEDLWGPEHAKSARDMGAKLLISVNASPFRSNIDNQRKEILRRRVEESGLGIVYVNLVGGQDELVFDGGSMVVDENGQFIFEAPQFEEQQYLVEISESNGALEFHAKIEAQKQASSVRSIYECLTLGVRDYVRKNGFEGAIIGLSGGIDSALTTIIAVDALGAKNVNVLLMPSRYSAEMSTQDAVAMAEGLGIGYHIIPIEEPFVAFTDALSGVFHGLPVDITEENIQARCRGVLLMAVSNKTGKLVLTTSNKSEMAIGAAAIYGDMAGAFTPLKDVSKTLVYELAAWRNSQNRVIPQRIIDRAPSAELRPNQLDTDSRPPYDILDPIIERYVELDQSLEDIASAGFSAEVVAKVIAKIDRNEFKRRQAAPGIKITERAFGRERRYPITSGFK